MLMRKLKVFYVFLGLMVLGVVGESILTRPRFKLDEKAKVKLAEIPGEIEVKFVGSKKYWDYSIVNGELLLRALGDFPPAHLEARPYIYFAKEVPDGLPKIVDFKYYGPYRESPDKSVMFLSLSSKERYFPRDFVLIQMNNKGLPFGKKEHAHWIEDMAWSPNSSMFAVLGNSSRIYFGATGILSVLFGHPVDICKYYLSVYDRQGNLLLDTPVASGVLGGGGRVYWQDKGKIEGSEDRGVRP